jgi:hypothetical protein
MEGLIINVAWCIVLFIVLYDNFIIIYSFPEFWITCCINVVLYCTYSFIGYKNQTIMVVNFVSHVIGFVIYHKRIFTESNYALHYDIIIVYIFTICWSFFISLKQLF